MPRTKLAPKKQRQLFVAKVIQLLLDAGAKPDGGEVYPLTLQTKAGRLELFVTENMTEGLGTMYACFDDPQAARQLVDCNPFCGKWNFHFFAGWDVDSALNELAYQLKKVLP